MNNVSSLLFENLMKYNEVNKKRSYVKEEDETILNLQVELPQDLEDIKPDDINVDVGIMPIEADEKNDNTEVENDEEDEIDVTPEDEEDNQSNKDDDKKESVDVETAKKNIINRVKNKTENKDAKYNCKEDEDCECESCKSKKHIKTESLTRLDTNSLNHLITTFVKDNYKNIDKIVISKAVLENKKLTLTGSIINTSGKKESIKLTNTGFDVKKLEGKKFAIDFSDTNNTFNIMKESVKKPFVFIASLKEGILKFESLKYNYKTCITEGKIAQVYGKCKLTESKQCKYNKSKSLKEATLKSMSGVDSYAWQGANDFADGTKPFIAEGEGGTLLVSGSDENDGTALISIYYGPDGDQWAWKSYDNKEIALKDAKLLVNIIDDEEVDVNQLKRFGFDIM